MSIKRTFNGKTIIKPGAYTKIVVENLTGFPLSATGVVGIIGDAVGGEPGVLDILSREGIQDAKSRYKSGPIADALELIANPSKDPRVPNGASTIVVWKTNPSTQSQLYLKNGSAIDQILLKSKNFGTDENLVNVLVSAGAILNSQALIAGTIAGTFNLAGAETLILSVSGVTYTFTNTLVGAAITTAALVGELNTGARWAPSKPVIASGTTTISITIDTALAKLDYGYIKVDATSTLDTIVGITGSNRGVKGSRFVTTVKDLISELSLELGGETMLSITYSGTGTDCALSIKDVLGELRLTTVCTGAAGDNLDLLLVDAFGNNKFTMKTLTDVINQNAAYTSSVTTKSQFVNCNELDYYDAIQIKGVALPLKKDVKAMVDHFNTFSQFVGATKLSNVYKEVVLLSVPAFLSGAVDGASANSNYAAGFEAFKEERINCVVPLISKDTGAVTIDSVNALAVSHAAWGWQTDGKSERHNFSSKLASKADFKLACQTAQSGYTSMFGQQIRVLDKTGTLVWLDPWGAACIAAGMRAGAEVGEPLTFKVVNVNDIRVYDGSWNPKKDYAEMLEAGCMFMEPLDGGGFRFVLGNTTYGVDASFVWNRESVVQASGYVAYDLRSNLESEFTGTKAKTGRAEAIANFIKARMSLYFDGDIIVGDDLNEGLGYKNLRVNIQGNTAIINVSITPVQGVDFILPTIYLADIRQSA